MKKFGEIVREAIREKRMTLLDVATGVGSFKGYISGICTGKLNPPSPKIVRKLCKVLDLDFDEMLARGAFEKLPHGLRYGLLEKVLVEARLDGIAIAPGKSKGW